MEHLVVVGVHRDVGVDVAVAGVHMQRHKNPAPQDVGVDGLELFHHGMKGCAGKESGQRRLQLRLPGEPHRVVLDTMKEREGYALRGISRSLSGAVGDTQFGIPGLGFVEREVEMIEKPLPAVVYGG